MARRTTPQLVLLLALLLAVLTALVASNHYFQGRLLSVHARAETIVRNIERIRYYDEVLTGSARSRRRPAITATRIAITGWRPNWTP